MWACIKVHVKHLEKHILHAPRFLQQPSFLLSLFRLFNIFSHLQIHIILYSTNYRRRYWQLMAHAVTKKHRYKLKRSIWRFVDNTFLYLTLCSYCKKSSLFLGISPFQKFIWNASDSTSIPLPPSNIINLTRHAIEFWQPFFIPLYPFSPTLVHSWLAYGVCLQFFLHITLLLIQ